MKDDNIICVCCKEDALVVFSYNDEHEAFALCLDHAIAHQKIINHCEIDYKLEMLID